MKEPLSVRIYKFTKEARPGWSVERLEDETYFPDWISEIRELEAEIERLKAERDRMREALEKIAKIDYLRWIVSRYEVTQESGKQAVLLAETALAGAGEG